MKQTTLLYNCSIWKSNIILCVEHWHVGTYPMTMTPRECLEDWCESVGWKLDRVYGADVLSASRRTCYEFRFERPRVEDISNTIIEACYTHERKLGLLF